MPTKSLVRKYRQPEKVESKNSNSNSISHANPGQREKEERRRWEEEKLQLGKERFLRLETESFQRMSHLVDRRQEVLAAAQALEEQSYERTPSAFPKQNYTNNDYSQHQQMTYTHTAQKTPQQPLLQSVDYNQQSASQ